MHTIQFSNVRTLAYRFVVTGFFYNKAVTGWIDAMDQETNGSQIEAVLFLPAQCTRNQMGTSTW